MMHLRRKSFKRGSGRMLVTAVHVDSIRPSRNAVTLWGVVIGALVGVALSSLRGTPAILSIVSGVVLGASAGVVWWNNVTVRRTIARHSPPRGIESTAHRVAPNNEPADWILQRLHRFALDVGSFVPDGFDAYARILHPPIRNKPEERIEVRWKDIAAANGRTVDEEVLMTDIDGSPSQTDSSGEQLWDEQPRTGTLTREIATALVESLREHTQSPDKCWFAVWEGWGGFAELWPTAPRVAVPQRDMLLFAGPITDARLTFDDVDWHYRSPSLWWPDDKAWCVATEVDATWTYVGGSHDCIARLLNDPRLEAVPVTATTIR